MRTGKRRTRKTKASAEESEPETEPKQEWPQPEWPQPDAPPVAGPDREQRPDESAPESASSDWPNRGVVEAMALRQANERLAQDNRGLEARIKLLEDENENLRTSLAQMPPPDDAGLLALIEHAIAIIERITEVANFQDRWPTKTPEKERRSRLTETKSWLPRLRGFRDALEIYAEKDTSPADAPATDLVVDPSVAVAVPTPPSKRLDWMETQIDLGTEFWAVDGRVMYSLDKNVNGDLVYVLRIDNAQIGVTINPEDALTADGDLTRDLKEYAEEEWQKHLAAQPKNGRRKGAKR